MRTKASAMASEVRTDPRAEVEERGGSTGGLVRTLTIVGLACLILPGRVQAQSFISGWGPVVFDSRWNSEAFVDVAAGGKHTVARRGDGSVVAWGDNGAGQCNVPALPGGLTYVEIAAGWAHTVARRSDGSLVAWGDNGWGQCNAPALPAGLTYVEIAAGLGHTVARRSDGSVVAWGDNSYGQCNVPALPAGLTYAEVAAGANHTVARYGLAASVVSVGTGCGGAGMPVFGCNAPRIGQNVTFSLTQGTPNASGYLYYSGVPAAPIMLGSGCTVEVDLATFSPLVPVVANATGAWSVTAGPVDPSLPVGLQVALQIALFSTSGPLGIDLSNGLIATVGY
jgi:Regulator of chromosome condensation (RCC1) repeat